MKGIVSRMQRHGRSPNVIQGWGEGPENGNFANPPWKIRCKPLILKETNSYPAKLI